MQISVNPAKKSEHAFCESREHNFYQKSIKNLAAMEMATLKSGKTNENLEYDYMAYPGYTIFLTRGNVFCGHCNHIY